MFGGGKRPNSTEFRGGATQCSRRLGPLGRPRAQGGSGAFLGALGTPGHHQAYRLATYAGPCLLQQANFTGDNASGSMPGPPVPCLPCPHSPSTSVLPTIGRLVGTYITQMWWGRTCCQHGSSSPDPHRAVWQNCISSDRKCPSHVDRAVWLHCNKTTCT